MFEIYELTPANNEDDSTLVLKIPKQKRSYSSVSERVFTGSHKTREETKAEIQDKADRGIISHWNEYVTLEIFSARHQGDE